MLKNSHLKPKQQPPQSAKGVGGQSEPSVHGTFPEELPGPTAKPTTAQIFLL